MKIKSPLFVEYSSWHSSSAMPNTKQVKSVIRSTLCVAFQSCGFSANGEKLLNNLGLSLNVFFTSSKMIEAYTDTYGNAAQNTVYGELFVCPEVDFTQTTWKDAFSNAIPIDSDLRRGKRVNAIYEDDLSDSLDDNLNEHLITKKRCFLLGDILIGYEEVMQSAKAKGITPKDVTIEAIVNGVLFLLGFTKSGSVNGTMEVLVDKVIKTINIAKNATLFAGKKPIKKRIPTGKVILSNSFVSGSSGVGVKQANI